MSDKSSDWSFAAIMIVIFLVSVGREEFNDYTAYRERMARIEAGCMTAPAAKAATP